MHWNLNPIPGKTIHHNAISFVLNLAYAVRTSTKTSVFMALNTKTSSSLKYWYTRTKMELFLKEAAPAGRTAEQTRRCACAKDIVRKCDWPHLPNMTPASTERSDSNTSSSLLLPYGCPFGPLNARHHRVNRDVTGPHASGSAEEIPGRGLAGLRAQAGEDCQQIGRKRERLHHQIRPLHRPEHLRATQHGIICMHVLDFCKAASRTSACMTDIVAGTILPDLQLPNTGWPTQAQKPTNYFQCQGRLRNQPLLLMRCCLFPGIKP